MYISGITLRQRFGAAASKYVGKILAFAESYLMTDTPRGVVPFGGRSQQFNFLEQWLADEMSPPRFVLAGGRGKSALLVHWINRLQESGRIGKSLGQWELAFVPISMRFGTNLPQVFYEALSARLAEILGQDLEPAHADPEAYYQDKCRELLENAIVHSKMILVVIDGIDEALGARFEASWFPLRCHSLRLLVSARLQVGDRHAADWIERLGWSSGARVLPYDLPILDSQGVEEILRTTGAPVECLPRSRRSSISFLS